jgi:transposase, IS5 family
MYKSTEKQQSLNLFPMNLISKNDEWLKLTHLMPWFEIEEQLQNLFSDSGRNAIPIRVIIGALVIQVKMGLTDRETVDVISSTPRLQYFIGRPDFDPEYTFDFSLLSKYRKKLGLDVTQEMIDVLLKHHQIIRKVKLEPNQTHYGSMSIDATVVPVNITYPTDLKLLNKVREQSETLIDELYKASSLQTKPRTYRENARKDYLFYAKKKNLSRNTRFTANRKQLQYIKRNIQTIENHANTDIFVLNDIQKETLSIIKTIYEQQSHMWENKVNKVEHRIVNFAQNHIRGIVRGKAGTKIEFGPKIAVSKVNGYITLDKISFDNFHEAKTLKDIIEKYKETYGCYPESIRADQIYQTRENKILCKELNIRLSGKPLGRPKKDKDLETDQIMKDDMKKRIEIEGLFGTAKTKYGLSNLMTKLPDTQKASIGLVFFVMNLMLIQRKISFYENLEVAYFVLTENENAFIFEKSDMYFEN